MDYGGKIGRLSIKRFGHYVLASLFAVLAVTSLLQIAAPTQAQGTQAPVTQVAQPNKPTDAVLDWNAIAQTTVLTAAAPAPQQYRTLAIVHAAIFDAVNAIDRQYTPYAVDIKAAGASPDAAVAAAAHTVLTNLYPLQKATLDAAFTKALAKLSEGQPKTDGITLGQTVAEKLLSLRNNDGADQKVGYSAEQKVGVWQPTPPLFLPAMLPYWSTVTPFVIKRADQFKIPAPLPLNSAAYAKELNEVKRLGGKNSAARTPDQTAAAIWSAVSPVVLWNTTAKAAATAKGNSLSENARLFALLNLAGVDAYIAGYDVKYKYKLWRPAIAIPQAEQLGNPGITADPNWEALIVTPNHPDYISGHCVTAGADERILENFFGSDAVKVNIIFPANAGVTRSFTSFSQISKELGETRIWAGVHTRTADTQGDVLGKAVGDYVFQNALRPLKS
ncbi:vanadium-dependent haloperoxidase [Leptolyngbya sp. FACHB-321]|uniref:vanadium-dependent haloperoxidase n=1 Tax=Leptolyngbya sp. FACHB-321 TaxID=2692807 RepID=UPI001685B5B3|nr:vanadium-dependent haloperoxidase [Leptolyngbya sp. FACHB-321]MBD2035868.1 vanadium-dependent haloperoxidase [Leptolyngbya sp. FACHB-321]